MNVSTAVAAWLAASAPLPGEDAAQASQAIATAVVEASIAIAPPPDDIVVSGTSRPPREDPLQTLNTQTYAATQALDTAIVAPAARAYSSVIPSPIRAGVRNFFNHVTLPVVFINDLLQLKIGRAAQTLARFAINSTVGVVGLFDVAKRPGINIPYRRNGFANTLGHYGVKAGAFLFVPLIGPTTIRDLFGLVLDRMVVPTLVGKPFNTPAYAIGATIVGSIDYRAEYDAELRKIAAEANPYAAARANYLRNRQAEIDAIRGRVATPPEGYVPEGPPPRR
jgi:phospholipid-binding lipoprotein MlaA